MTALSVLEAASAGDVNNTERQHCASFRSPCAPHQLIKLASPALVSSEVRNLFSPFDLKRLDSYANNMLDYHVILDLLPTLAALYFSQRFPADIKLSGVQSSILLALGLQRKPVEDIEVRSVPARILSEGTTDLRSCRPSSSFPSPNPSPSSSRRSAR